jgi:hypothetical protein
MNITLLFLMIILSALISSCGKTASKPSDTINTVKLTNDLPLRAANEALVAHKLILHDRLQYAIISKEWGWMVTVGNITGRQPLDQAYYPDDCVYIEIGKEGNIIKYYTIP